MALLFDKKEGKIKKQPELELSSWRNLIEHHQSQVKCSI